jgi:hypothetical protein
MAGVVSAESCYRAGTAGEPERRRGSFGGRLDLREEFGGTWNGGEVERSVVSVFRFTFSMALN